ncbi:MAG: hypothetical protein LBN98_05335 [Prevotellaceae bacterium]|nr:hypothetical protein [Prevotellaceae bacterium]
MKKENLEKFIKNHLPAFGEEPAGGHYERLQAKWSKARRHAKIMAVSRMAAAACVAAAITVTVFLYTPPPAAPQETAALCEKAADMKSCYFGKMHDVAEQIREIAATLDNIDRQEVMMEVDFLLAAGNDMELELPDELPDDAVAAVLSGYYQRHLESLQTIAEMLTEADVMM